MDGDTAKLLVTTGGVVAGLVVMLYGVSLTAGESTNAFMLVGGAIIVVAIGVLATWEMGSETEHDHDLEAETSAE
jgi:ABC-type nickel/cobalt efflux system permease component RcnA